MCLVGMIGEFFLGSGDWEEVAGAQDHGDDHNAVAKQDEQSLRSAPPKRNHDPGDGKED